MRKTDLYREGRVRKRFQTTAILNELEERARDKIMFEDRLRLELGIAFSAENGDTHWREYGTTLVRLFAALASRAVAPDMRMHLNSASKILSYDIASEIEVGAGKDEVVKRVKTVMDHLLYPDCTRFAEEPIRVSLVGHGYQVLSEESFRLSFYPEKSLCNDFIVLDDLPLVLSYYRQIAETVLSDIAQRGLTIYAAVDAKDGESIIRRNNVGRNRLVVNDVEELGRLITDYDAFRFIPDVNTFGSDYVSRIPIDLDRPSTMPWKDYAEFVNGFKSLLEGRGFKPRLRLTGGKGAQLILDITVDHTAKTFTTPFPRPEKFDTYISRHGLSGLVCAQAADLVKILALAYGIERKRLGKPLPLTVEMHDLTQRYWNVFADSSRVLPNMGVVSVGSIHHWTGGVCMPVKCLPETLSVESAMSVAHWTVDKSVDFDPRYKSPWIQAIGRNPLLLQEPSLSSTDNPFSLVEETFRDYGWIPAEYVKMGSERFMGKYCWS